jgi:hypothetical protein
VQLPQVEGQAIAWDRTRGIAPTLWAIKRSTSQVLTFTVPYRSIVEPPRGGSFHVYGPDQIQK